MTAIFDLGLQVERTALAWRRSALSLGATSLGAARLLTSVSAPWAAGVTAAGLMGATVIAALAWRRYTAVPPRLLTVPAEGAVRLPGGAMLMALAVLQAFGGLIFIVLLL